MPDSHLVYSLLVFQAHVGGGWAVVPSRHENMKSTHYST